jgi:hypothetical protein
VAFICSGSVLLDHGGRTCLLYIHCQRISQARNQHEAGRFIEDRRLKKKVINDETESDRMNKEFKNKDETALKEDIAPKDMLGTNASQV